MVGKMQAVFDTLVCFGIFVDWKILSNLWIILFCFVFSNSRIPEFEKV